MIKRKQQTNTTTMKLLITTVGALLSLSSFAGGETRLTKNDYVEQYKAEAIRQMNEHKVPASITLAQGILESAAGNSTLARKGNNHFGIKCHGWTGKKMYMDDDAKGECFRVYKSVDESFTDHSLFLNKYDRYAFLFTYDVSDYKAWAKGLRQAGYATSSTYATALIGLIEDLGLDQYDAGFTPEIEATPELIASSTTNSSNSSTAKTSNSHDVKIHENKVKYVVAKKGDTFYKISKEFGLTLKQLYRYNDFGKEKDYLETGDVIFLQPKRKRSLFKKNEVVVNKQMSVNELSQLYAVNAKTIMHLNNFTDGNAIVSTGDKVTLR
ncbi:MAG: LysM repeat protein [Crocinitomicaceae bacterium]|jgi:LysM repeat protein